MATSRRTQDLDLNRSVLGETVRKHPGRFDFFQLVRVIERLNGGVPVGLYGPPEKEAMRFSVHNSLAFPPSQVHSLDWPEGGRPTVTVNFMGLTGPNGVLPFSYTEFVRDRIRSKDRTLSEFLDIFNHRAVSLFYQAWEKYRAFVGYERNQEDRFSKYLMCFVGLGTPGLQFRQSVRDESFLYYCGLLSLQSRSAIAIEQILADYFDVPVEVEQFVGAWYSVDSTDQCYLDEGEAFSEQIGLGAVVGDEIWHHGARARVKLGPLSIGQYLEFLPGGEAHKPLQTMLKFFAGHEFEFEVQLVLRREDVPSVEVGRRVPAIPLLGWTTWMKSSPSFGRDPGDAVLLLN